MLARERLTTPCAQDARSNEAEEFTLPQKTRMVFNRRRQAKSGASQWNSESK
jgi:hypothetical protein